MGSGSARPRRVDSPTAAAPAAARGAAAGSDTTGSNSSDDGSPQWDSWVPAANDPPVAGAVRFDLSDPFENRAGPFWVDTQRPYFYLRLRQQHCNSGRIAHGGLLMTLADATAAATASRAMDNAGFTVTVSCTNNFLGVVKEGDLLWSKARVTRVSKKERVVFVRGEIRCARGVAEVAGGVDLNKNDEIQWRNVFTFDAVFMNPASKL